MGDWLLFLDRLPTDTQIGKVINDLKIDFLMKTKRPGGNLHDALDLGLGSPITRNIPENAKILNKGKITKLTCEFCFFVRKMFKLYY